MALVPIGTVAQTNAELPGVEGKRDVLIVPAGRHLNVSPETGAVVQPKAHVSSNKALGGYFVLTMLLVILITNASLRGIWSLVVVFGLLAITFFLGMMNLWDTVLGWFGLVEIYINASGYLLIATSIFLMWACSFFGFDYLFYTVFTPGQFRVHLTIGEGETAFDALGMVIHKRRNDFFRHWLLGGGSGDLIIKTGGAQPQTFEIPNVLFAGWKVRYIQKMLQEREVIEEPVRIIVRPSESTKPADLHAGAGV
jgi:hypothetical protein